MQNVPPPFLLTPMKKKIKTRKPHDSKSIFLDFPSFSHKIIDIGKKKKTKNKEEEENPISIKQNNINNPPTVTKLELPSRKK